MRSNKVLRFIGGCPPVLARTRPEHFKPKECEAWNDIVTAIAPYLHLMEDLDWYYLELAASSLASFRTYAHQMDDLTRAREAKVLYEILELALVPERTIPALIWR